MGDTMFLIVHGGAGSRRPSLKALKRLAESVLAGYDILRAAGTALEAVVKAVEILENSGLFNAGCGASLQYDGIRRLDASVMDGRTLGVGSVMGLEGVRNPVIVARMLMEIPSVMMTNVGAARIAAAHNLDLLAQPDEKALRKLERALRRRMGISKLYHEYFSTVWAVAVDEGGNFAAASSTGGIAGMLPGRVGDTPVIGAGIYAENAQGAVACTGLGEYIIRLSLAKEICMNMREMKAERAARFSLKRLLGLGGEGGVIVLTGRETVIMHTTKYMPAGYVNKRGLSGVREAFRRISVR
ncbi:MAG: isoaspartyl peptidase/L-asparaginase [Candidatus Sulfobium sp.]|jgi:beta-aspartyl-peptidase (threonine type)